MGERPRFKKIVLLLLAGMIALFAGLTLLGQFRKDLDFHGVSMAREDQPGRTVYTGYSVGQNEKTALAVACVPEGEDMRVEFVAGAGKPQAYQVADGQAERLTAEVQEDCRQGWEGFRFGEEDALFFAGLPEPDRVRASWGGWLAVTVFALLVMFRAAFPKALFHLRYMWQVEEPEPTALFWLGHYFGTGLLVLLILVFYVMALAGIPL